MEVDALNFVCSQTVPWDVFYWDQKLPVLIQDKRYLYSKSIDKSVQ